MMEFSNALAILVILVTMVAIGYSWLKYYRYSKRYTRRKQVARWKWFEQTPITVFFCEGESRELIREKFEDRLIAAEEGTELRASSLMTCRIREYSRETLTSRRNGMTTP